MKKLVYKDANLTDTVVALGKFEGLHLGHMLLVDEVKRLAEQESLTSVICTIDAEGRKRVLTVPERDELLGNLGIDINVTCPFTASFASMTPEQFISDILVKFLHPGYVVVGEDFRFGCNRSGDVSTLKKLGDKYGFQVIAYPKLKERGQVISSSRIRTCIEEGRVEDANRMMGRPYAIRGTVLHGKKLGRTIGFPTANLIADDSKLLPLHGVYETQVIVDGSSYRGITNVGGNPTVECGNQIKIETNLLNFEKNIYNQGIQVNFLRFLRQEIKFDSIDDLKNQIKEDKIAIMHQ